AEGKGRSSPTAQMTLDPTLCSSRLRRAAAQPRGVGSTPHASIPRSQATRTTVPTPAPTSRSRRPFTWTSTLAETRSSASPARSGRYLAARLSGSPPPQQYEQSPRHPRQMGGVSQRADVGTRGGWLLGRASARSGGRRRARAFPLVAAPG